MKPYKHSMPYGGGVPRHWRCRSTEVPYLKTFKELGFDIEEFPKGTQWTPEGEVAGDMSFEDWLRSKPDKEVEGLLGKKRADLFLSGKLSLGDFLDMSGRPLTLDQLGSRVRTLEDGLTWMQKNAPRTRQATRFAARQAVMWKATSEATEAFVRWHRRRQVAKLGGNAPVNVQDVIASSLRDLLDRTATMTALTETLRRSGVVAHDLDRLHDLDHAKDTAMELDRMRTAFPEVEVNELLTDQLGRGKIAESVTDPDLLGLRLNYHYLNSQDLVENLASQKLSRWRAEVPSNLRTVTTHEFGHQVLAQLDKVGGVGSSRGVIGLLKKSIPDLSAADISEYALSSPEELFAETFMACQWIPKEQWTPWMSKFYDMLTKFVGDRSWDAPGFYEGI